MTSCSCAYYCAHRHAEKYQVIDLFVRVAVATAVKALVQFTLSTSGVVFRVASYILIILARVLSEIIAVAKGGHA